MNISYCGWFARSHSCRTVIVSPSFSIKSRPFLRRNARFYATHRDTPDLSQSLDTRRQRVRPAESAGPFQLGVSQSSFGSEEKVKKWSELSATGKVKRTTARTTNLTVILFGAGLSAVLVYCLTSELFSKNSPTVLHNDACERLKASPQVAKYLHGPLTFHNNPPSLGRPRHRNHHVTSEIMLDSTGREHMFLNFFVQGRPLGEVKSESKYEAVTGWIRDASTSISELTIDGATEWMKDQKIYLSEQFKRVFRYLTGAPAPPLSQPAFASADTGSKEKEESTVWQFAGMFSSLRRSRGNTEPPADGRVFTDGEVHAELVMNNDGYFVFRYILVDIPNSREQHPIRVFVERTGGVREHEPVKRWYA
ncbi:TIM21-domain-containing protein [Desarmillaria tabescens]|uniref:Mitochondrial import inner membrane translocase subunit Tim21 n=1 Tax=Armillaria tabescens TaxID=1929756 RepID=A0AA39NGL3_ARMTA|nr:TIM21-domain-containing protein [Desarmillaria tabescens]KAK0465272.1 TIM21-domain-containing protein [Desarmillaria tabescens]